MHDNAEFIDALNQIEREKGIDKETIFEAIETSLVSACKKNFGTSQNVKVIMDRESGHVEVFSQKEVVEVVEDENIEMSLDEAKKANAIYELGDIVDYKVTPRNFGRIAAQTAKQVVVQKFREAEREILYNEFITKEKEIVFGKVQRTDNRNNVIIDLGKAEAILTATEKIQNEEYKANDRIRVYVLEVKKSTKGPQINVSRTHPEFVKRLFELEVPEVREGIVEIKSIAREAGNRTKIAVYSHDENVDAVGACVGPSGYRVNVIVDELRGEKIDIIEYSDVMEEYISSALSPSKVISVKLNENDSAQIIVPDNQLSLAIGKEGQNARLAAKLTGWKIDIKSEEQADSFNFMDELDKAILNVQAENEEMQEETALEEMQEKIALKQMQEEITLDEIQDDEVEDLEEK